MDICQVYCGRPCRLYFLYDLFSDFDKFFLCLRGRLRGFGLGIKFVNLRFAIAKKVFYCRHWSSRCNCR